VGKGNPWAWRSGSRPFHRSTRARTATPSRGTWPKQIETRRILPAENLEDKIKGQCKLWKLSYDELSTKGFIAFLIHRMPTSRRKISRPSEPSPARSSSRARSQTQGIRFHPRYTAQAVAPPGTSGCSMVGARCILSAGHEQPLAPRTAQRE